VVGIERHPSNLDTVEDLVQDTSHLVAGGDDACRIVREAGQNLDFVPTSDKPACQNAGESGRSGLGVVPLGQEADAHGSRPSSLVVSAARVHCCDHEHPTTAYPTDVRGDEDRVLNCEGES